MKKVISILLVVAMLACFMVTPVSATEVEPAKVKAATVTGTKGQNVAMDVTIASNPGFRSYKVVLEYPSADLEVVSVNSEDDITINTNNAGKIVVTYGKSTIVTGDHKLFSVTFKVLGGCTDNGYGVSVDVNELFTKSEDGRAQAVPVTVTNGKVNVNHNWVAGQAVPAANCQTQGYTPYTCSICGATENRGFVNGDHVEGTAVRENEVAATCTAAGKYDKVVYCSVCNAELRRDTVTGTAAGHSYGDFTIVTAATCTQAGLKERTCSVCSHVEQQVIPTVAHTFGTTWMTNENQHWHECSVCGAHCDEGDHYFSVQRDGYFWCAVCNYKGPKIPTDIDDVPKTGDITPVVTFGAVALISMAAAAAYVVSRKFAK